MLSLRLGAVALSANLLIRATFASYDLEASPQGQRELLTVMGRTAHVYKPPGFESERKEKVPAVLVLHGSGRVAKDSFGKGFDALADQHHFLVVYPEMLIPGSESWGDEKDIPYFTELVHRLQDDQFRVDPSRVFICGHSAGGSMALFLQNEVDIFSKAGAVEAAVGKLEKWDMSKRGRPTMVIWNHADPVLWKYAPRGDEKAYYDLTIATLRRHGDRSWFKTHPLPTSYRILSAAAHHYPEDTAPQLRMVGFTSQPGTHSWANRSWCTFSATEELVKFFFDLDTNTGSIVDGKNIPNSGASGFLGGHSTKAMDKLGIVVFTLMVAAVSLCSILTICIRASHVLVVLKRKRLSASPVLLRVTDDPLHQARVSLLPSRECCL